MSRVFEEADTDGIYCIAYLLISVQGVEYYVSTIAACHYWNDHSTYVTTPQDMNGR